MEQNSGEMSREAAKTCPQLIECCREHQSMTVTLRCEPCDATRRVESLEGRRPGSISAVHPSRLG